MSQSLDATGTCKLGGMLRLWLRLRQRALFPIYLLARAYISCLYPCECVTTMNWYRIWLWIIIILMIVNIIACNVDQLFVSVAVMPKYVLHMINTKYCSKILSKVRLVGLDYILWGGMSVILDLREWAILDSLKRAQVIFNILVDRCRTSSARQHFKNAAYVIRLKLVTSTF